MKIFIFTLFFSMILLVIIDHIRLYMKDKKIQSGFKPVSPFIPEERNFEIKRNFIAYDRQEIHNLLRKLDGSTVKEISATLAQQHFIRSIKRDYLPTVKKFNRTIIQCR